jgi:hypothetical protein
MGPPYQKWGDFSMRLSHCHLEQAVDEISDHHAIPRPVTRKVGATWCKSGWR